LATVATRPLSYPPEVCETGREETGRTSLGQEANVTGPGSLVLTLSVLPYSTPGSAKSHYS
jgi:hypothetical protein